MAQFGEITFTEVNENGGKGIYDGREFQVINNDWDGSMVEGDFNDDERQFIFTQWEMVQ